MSNVRPITRAIDLVLPLAVHELLPERHLARYVGNGALRFPG